MVQRARIYSPGTEWTAPRTLSETMCPLWGTNHAVYAELSLVPQENTQKMAHLAIPRNLRTLRTFRRFFVLELLPVVPSYLTLKSGAEYMNAEESSKLFGNLGYVWGAATDKGKLRSENEDAYHIEPEIGLFLVSDGMGGHQGGALASKIVTEDLPAMIETRLHSMRSASKRAIRTMLKKVVMEQSRQLWLEGLSESGYKEMGATLVLALLQQNRVFMTNLGDSRFYRLRKDRLIQISKDHSVISELLEAGQIKPEQARNHPAQGMITHYVGMEPSAHAHSKTFRPKPSDRLLLCTDGLTDMVSIPMLHSVLKETQSPQETCDRLVQIANEAGGHDNITVIVIDYHKKN